MLTPGVVHLGSRWRETREVLGRDDSAEMEITAFELNRTEYAGATILIGGRNFGCGSSREHAAWGLEDAGFRVVISPSFGDIFRANAVKNGMAPIELGEAALTKLKEAVSDTNELTVDLEQLEIIHPGGLRVSFELDPYSRETLLHGLDDIARTLTREAKISAYEAAHAARYDARALSG